MMATDVSFSDRLLRRIGRSALPGTRGLLSRLGVLRKHRDISFVVEFNSLRYKGQMSEYVDRHIWYFGAYSANELDFLDHAARVQSAKQPIVTFLDIGANVGQHSLFMSTRCQRVIAFEPNPDVANRLKINCEANGLTNVEIHLIALGSEDGTAVLGSGLPANSGSRSLAWSMDKTQDLMIQVRHAGRYLSSEEILLNKIDIIKIDVEGFEKSVFSAMAALLQRDRPVILFELVGKDIKGGFKSETELRQTLYKNYQLFSVSGSRRAKLLPFQWDGCEEAVCIPAEFLSDFRQLMV